MLPYMFTPERDLPPEAGFPGFGPEHLAMLAVLAAISAGVVLLGCRMESKHRTPISASTCLAVSSAGS